MFDRITVDPQIMGGRACIRGMRIPVSVVVGQIAHGADFDEVLEDHPDLRARRHSASLGIRRLVDAGGNSHRLKGERTRFLADMGVSPMVVEWLRSNGHDAVHLRDERLHRLPN